FFEAVFRRHALVTLVVVANAILRRVVLPCRQDRGDAVVFRRRERKAEAASHADGLSNDETMGCSAIHMFYSRKAAMPHGHGISARGAESRSGSKHEAAAFSRTAACEPAARHHRRAACFNEPPPLE